MLLFTWIISALTILGIILYARFYQSEREDALLHGEHRLSDVLTEEMLSLHRDLRELFEVLKPHGKRSLSAGLVMVKRGQDLFISRVYGRIQCEKGRASSFFLKQIAEHQGKDAERENSERSV